MRSHALDAVTPAFDFVETGWQGDELDRALAKWLLGEAEATAPLGSCFGVVEREGGVAALVTLDGSTMYGTAAARQHAPAFTRAVASSRPHRAYGTSREERWAWVTDAGLSWIACEPAGESAMLVAAGATDESRDEILVRLPRLARACGVVIDQLRTKVRAREIRHTLKNLLAAAKGNADLARISTDQPEQQAVALDNVVEAIGRMDAAIRRQL